MMNKLKNALLRLILIPNAIPLLMAVRKAIVLVGGELQQLQSGDTLAGPVAEVAVIALTNDDSGAHALGDVVYIDAADGVKKAKADAGTTAQAIAIATGAISAGAVGNYQTDGILAGLTGLTAGAIYYLSDATAALITLTAPSTVGHYVTRIGRAISTTELEISIERAILL
jgi:hypothetical protein